MCGSNLGEIARNHYKIIIVVLNVKEIDEHCLSFDLFRKKYSTQQMSRKTVSDMFYTAELENEIRHGKFFPVINECRFRKNKDREA